MAHLLPRLTIWEDAFDRGYIARGPRGDGIPIVTVTARGLDLLAAEGRRPGGREG